MKNLLYVSIFAMVFALPQIPARAQDERPNIILIIADDIGWDDIGCYGNPIVNTPYMDKMANEGLLFHHFYLTTSSCSPSRTSIISGRYPHNTGAAELHTPLPAEVTIFPELLQNAGYYTAQAGKWHMGDEAKRGFNVVYDQGKLIGNGGEDMWIPSLQERPKDKPFFMWFAALDAHRPWGPNDFSQTHHPDQINVPVYLADSLATKSDLAQYYDEITRFDYFIGKVEEELKNQGVLENTIIVIISDNGRPFPRSKTRMYDSGIKSPMIIKWPDGIGYMGKNSKSLISSIDLAPTFLELAAVEITDNFQGKSFLSVLKNPEQKFRNYIFAEHNWHDHEAMERMVRTEDFMYILNLRPLLSNPGPADSNSSPSFEDLKNLRDQGKLNPAQADIFMHPRPFEEFYYCDEDGEQLLNRASLPADPEELLHLRDVLNRWRQETMDNSPSQLTEDWYDRETGKALEVDRIRGEMPGGIPAMKTNNSGPF